MKSISLTPFHNSQTGVISEGSHFKVVFSVIAKLRNDSEKDFTNVVILIFALYKKKIVENLVTTVKKYERLWKIEPFI